MSKSVGKAGNTFKMATITLGVLVIAAVVVIAVMASQNGKANADLKDSQQQVASLESQVSSLQNNLSSTQTQLTAATTAQAKAASDLAAAKAASDTQISALQKDISSKQSTIDSQAAQIKTMSYPRHFSSVDELTSWLQKDNTNTLYTNPTAVQKAQMAFILQIRAARAGYIMTVNIPLAGGLDLITNRALVGDVIYEVRAADDFVQRWGSISPAMPPYPIPPDSGQ